MESEQLELSVEGLSRLEAAELQKKLGGQGVVKDKTALSADKQGALAEVLLAVYAVQPLIGLIALWLSRPTRRTTFDRTIVVRDKNKVVLREETIHYDGYSTESPKQKVIDSLSKVLKVPVDDISKQIEAAESAEPSNEG